MAKLEKIQRGSIVVVLLLVLLFSANAAVAETLKVGIANFGEHPVLTAVIDGVKEGMAQNGYPEGSKVSYAVSHTNWDASLVPQMISKLQADKPNLIVAITTPVSQTAKNALMGSGIPLVFSTVTDPVAAKLTPSWEKGDVGISGVSDMQDMAAVLAFTRKLLPKAKTFGVPYNPGEDNDVALLKQIKSLAPASGFKVVAVGVDNTNDIPVRIQSLKGKADVIYVSGSNLLQSAAPAIAATAQQINMPTISVNLDHVKEGFFMAAFAVDYHQVGVKTGIMAAQILNGTDPASIAPVRMRYEDHVPKINTKLVKQLGLSVPAALEDCDCFVSE